MGVVSPERAVNQGDRVAHVRDLTQKRFCHLDLRQEASSLLSGSPGTSHFNRVVDATKPICTSRESCSSTEALVCEGSLTDPDGR